MGIAIHLPDDVAAHLRTAQPDMPLHVLESLALVWYQFGELNEEQIRRLSYRHGWPLRPHGLRYSPSGRGLLRERCRT